MDKLTQEQAQALWDVVAHTANVKVRDVVFEQITQDGWDVQDDVVIAPSERKPE